MGQKTNRMYDISAPPSDSICLVPYACMEWVLRQAAHDGHEDQREYQDGRRSHLLRIGNISLAVSQPSIPGCRHCRTSRCRPHRQQPPRSACERLQSLAFLPLLAPPAPVLKGCSGCLGPDFQLRPCCGAASQGCSGASNLRCSPTRKQNKKGSGRCCGSTTPSAGTGVCHPARHSQARNSAGPSEENLRARALDFWAKLGQRSKCEEHVKHFQVKMERKP